MKARDLRVVLERLCFAGRNMALVSGPRQCGKTTLSRMLLKRRSRARRCPKSSHDDFLALLRYSGFPEPLFAQDDTKPRLWRQ